jgi:Sporulation protein Cse60
MVLKTKVIESSSRRQLENSMNKFLSTLQEKDILDFKIISSQRKNTSPAEVYIVIIVYRE